MATPSEAETCIPPPPRPGCDCRECARDRPPIFPSRPLAPPHHHPRAAPTPALKDPPPTVPTPPFVVVCCPVGYDDNAADGSSGKLRRPLSNFQPYKLVKLEPTAPGDP